MAYEMACTRVHETDSAVCIHDDESEEDYWIPLSQVESMHFSEDGEGTIVMTDWIARQKGFT